LSRKALKLEHLSLYRGSELKTSRDIVLLLQECHNSKFGIFELLVYKGMFADALLTGINKETEG